jgi:hypothetical protein
LITNEIVFKIFKTLGLCFLGSFWRHKPEAGGFCLCVDLIIRGVSRDGGKEGTLRRSRFSFAGLVEGVK